jgi:23S rRNA-intervening sequence protein
MSVRFNHHNLDAFAVARQALVEGEALAVGLPRGYATLADQVRRALLHAYLGVAEAASRAGNDRQARFRASLGEASEAAAGLEAMALLKLVPTAKVEPVIALLGRLCAMLTRLSGPRR